MVEPRWFPPSPPPDFAVPERRRRRGPDWDVFLGVLTVLAFVAVVAGTPIAVLLLFPGGPCS